MCFYKSALPLINGINFRRRDLVCLHVGPTPSDSTTMEGEKLQERLNIFHHKSTFYTII